jgi:predicted nucleic acid-binding protein
LIYVVDASAAIGWFFRDKDEQDPDFLLDGSIKRIAPDLVFSEVANVLQRKVRTGQLNLQQAERALLTLPLSFDEIVSSEILFRRAFDISRGLDHSVYDCMYLAAAMVTENSFLVTSDKKFLAKVAAAGMGSHVRTVEAAHKLFVASQENDNG